MIARRLRVWAKARGAFARVTGVIIGSCLLVSAVAVAGDERATGPIVPRGLGEACVAPTGDMRRNHMDYIMHQRDETVVQGIRGKPFSLVDCIGCHVQHDTAGKAIRIDAEGQFCQSCHSYAAVKIDCFSCHRATPDQLPASIRKAHMSKKTKQ